LTLPRVISCLFLIFVERIEKDKENEWVLKAYLGETDEFYQYLDATL
jgi:hypothetical protein